VSASKGGPCRSQQLCWLELGRSGFKYKGEHHVDSGRNRSDHVSTRHSSADPHTLPLQTTDTRGTGTNSSPSAASWIQLANDNDHTAIQVGSIAGGCLASIVLAVAAVAGCCSWRSIKWKEEAKSKEVVRSPFALSFLTPSHHVLLSDITPYYKREHETSPNRRSRLNSNSVR